MSETLESNITLRLWGQDLDLERVSSILGREPTRSFEAGGRGPGGRIHPSSSWQWTTCTTVDKDLNLHIDQLRVMLTPEAISELRSVGLATMDLFCLWVSRYGYGGPTVRAQDMAFLGDVGLPLHFNFLVGSEDEDPVYYELP